MLIDWFTVGAQALNFLILVWLMKRFLYRPILAAIDARETRIAAELAQAAATAAEAQTARDDFRQKNEAFDQQRAALLTKATDDANAEREHLVADARAALTASSAKERETRRADVEQLHQTIARRTQHEVFAIARKVLQDVASASLEERTGAVFTEKVRALNGPAKAGLAAALKTASVPVLVRSAFDMPPAQRTAIQEALDQTFASTITIRYETAPELVSGIELSTDGQKVAWSIADYLQSMEQGVDAVLQAHDRPS
jgi:F-type H+-transporting ATPase subunit b